MNSTFRLRQTGREGRELDKRRPRLGRPCAAAGPGTPPPRRARDHAALQGRRTRSPLLTQKHKSAPHPSRTEPVASPPSRVLKGPAEIQLTARRGRGVGALRAGGSTDSGRTRLGAGDKGVASQCEEDKEGTPASSSSRPVFPPPACQPLSSRLACL